jgi:hypothetical protein
VSKAAFPETIYVVFHEEDPDEDSYHTVHESLPEYDEAVRAAQYTLVSKGEVRVSREFVRCS